jgi:hypothetical protein
MRICKIAECVTVKSDSEEFVMLLQQMVKLLQDIFRNGVKYYKGKGFGKEAKKERKISIRLYLREYFIELYKFFFVL